MAHVDAISRFPHLTLPKEYEEPVDPDFVDPPLVVPKSTEINISVVNSGSKAKLTANRKSQELSKFDFSEEHVKHLVSLQAKDPEVTDRLKIMSEEDVDTSPSRLKILLSNIDDFIVVKGVLYKVYYQPRSLTRCKAEKCSLQLVVPQDLKGEVMRDLHCEAHFSYQKTFYKAKEKYWWPGMFKDIKSFCESCIQCQEAKGNQKRPPLIPIESGFPWQIVGVDITEPHRMTRSGNQYILMFVDLFTKYVVAKAIPDMKAETVAKVFYQEIVCRYGAPEMLLSDRGSQFTSAVMRFTRELFCVKGAFTAAWNPRCDGMTERSNQTIVKCLSFLVNTDHDDWDERLPSAIFAYNTSPSFRSTDYTPYYLLFGRHCKGPADLRLVIPEQIPNNLQDYVTSLVNNLDEAAEMAKTNIRQHQIGMKEHFDKSAHKHTLQEGDKVFLYVHTTPKHLSRKLRHPWCGGFVIHKFLGPNTAKIRKLSDGKILKAAINVQRLKKCIDPDVPPSQTLATNLFPPLDNVTDDDIPDDNFAPFMATPSNNMSQSQSSQSNLTQQSSQPQYYTVEKILGTRTRNGQKQYHIKWKGYSRQHNQWVDDQDVNDVLREFINSNPIPPKKRKKKSR